MMTETIGAILKSGSSLLTGVSDTPQLDSYLLAGEVLGRSREWLMAHAEETVSADDSKSIEHLIHRRKVGEPIAYIRGSQPFWRRDFVVTHDTLIPRPDSELLIEIALERFDLSHRTVVDLGTGTGALAISLAEERPDWQVLGTDIDIETLKIAKQNAGDISNLRFEKTSWFTNISERFDLVISNPPYIRVSDSHLEALRFEPQHALVGGEDGLDCFRQIISKCRSHLNSNGHVLLEHGFDQQKHVIELLETEGFSSVEGFKDLQGQPRAVLARSGSIE